MSDDFNKLIEQTNTRDILNDYHSSYECYLSDPWRHDFCEGYDLYDSIQQGENEDNLACTWRVNEFISDHPEFELFHYNVNDIIKYGFD